MSMSGGMEVGSIDSRMNGKIERTGTNVVRKDREDSEDGKKRGMSGFLGKARGGKWSLSA